MTFSNVLKDSGFLSGFLWKNHKGSSIAERSVQRWFINSGFHVMYYTSDDANERCGRFDLRNVTSVKVAAGVPNALAIKIKGKYDTLVISFSNAADEAAWKKLWCSAVSAIALCDDSLTKYRDEQLALKLNRLFSDQEALPHSLSASWVRLLSPRRPPSSEEMEAVKRTAADMFAVPAETAEAMECRTMDTPPARAEEAVEWPTPRPTLISMQEPDLVVTSSTKSSCATPSEAEERDSHSAVPKTIEDVMSASVPTSSHLISEPPAAAEGLPNAKRSKAADEQLLLVDLPEGVSPGDKLRVTAPDGAIILLLCPQGARAGSKLEIAL
mmetsp:Transcript_43084/g.71628  ORF Transcript_43084/g.71628 Transcript_43084/m.71628 type:complete len:327 (-) Transcript_43084:368-1348(-)|eukprot:CAMPEP_0119335090 /NCGR_PEP_ID=MMETSP1333-20130426/88645_1 /TAXON_ID=418940 /ORGANISM="Scyphosphaera apsteinii, Strain RCC1455" /LENGTH=326 /DNA_ID=CAMNT_0007345551 /DNA_START=75 /DNA_END=1055 /DNA_ORIENTATION=+